MKVSVAMVTYNHERFIAQAIESVLMQETTFDYEFVIGEDCSTDRTREIVVDFQKRFPEKIRLLLRDKNVGAHENSAQTLAGCTGEYIALLEGDDYWTWPGKLQKQADFLDSHLECSLCFHPVTWFYESAEDIARAWPKHGSKWPQVCREFSSCEDILREIFIQTASVMLRNGILDKYPAWFRELNGADWPLYVLYGDKGKLGCVDDVMAVHRKHGGGISYGLDEETMYTGVIKMYRHLNAHLGFRYKDVIRPLLADYYFKLGVFYDQRGDTRSARACVSKSLANDLGNKHKRRLSLIKMLARLTFPSAYQLSKRLLKA